MSLEDKILGRNTVRFLRSLDKLESTMPKSMALTIALEKSDLVSALGTSALAVSLAGEAEQSTRSSYEEFALPRRSR
ncbi:MAG: hypothetical protein RLZZ450_7508 [Pseudomonadota bacterium]|jgi:hypothetical protein